MFLFWLASASYQRIATLKGDDDDEEEEIDDYKLHVMMKLSIINWIMVTIMGLFFNFNNVFLRESGYQVHRLATELIPAYFSTIPPTVETER